MTKQATSALNGFDLNCAVAMASGMTWRILYDDTYHMVQTWHQPTSAGFQGYWGTFNPWMSWDDAGPLLAAEKLSLECRGGDQWFAGFDSAIGEGVFTRRYLEGPTPLIAAMRAFVASKLGDVLELP